MGYSPRRSNDDTPWPSDCLGTGSESYSDSASPSAGPEDDGPYIVGPVRTVLDGDDIIDAEVVADDEDDWGE